MRFVLDASALITYLEDREGAAKVDALLNEAQQSGVEIHMSVVNWGEARHNFWRRHGEALAMEAFGRVIRLGIQLVDATRERAELAATLKIRNALPYADGFAAGLAMEKKARLVTSDSDFERVKDQVKLLRLR